MNRKQCSAINCQNYAYKHPELSFHRFPKDPDRCARWVQNLRNASLVGICSERLHQSYRVCSTHFDPSQFKRDVDVRSGLNWDAVPTRVNAPNPKPPLDFSGRKRKKERPGDQEKKIATAVFCAAWRCFNHSERGVRMYDFPTDTRRREKWLTFSRNNRTFTNDYNNKKLCEEHFDEDQFVKTRNGKTGLKSDAIPTIFVVKRRKVPTGCTPGLVNIERIAVDHSYSAKALIIPKTEERWDEKTERREHESEERQDMSSEEEEEKVIPAQPSPALLVTAAKPQGPELNKPIQDYGESVDEPGTWSIQWADEDSEGKTENVELQDQKDVPHMSHIIEVKGAWEWLGMDIKPMPATLNGNKYILTVTDYYSKWVEAFPLRIRTPLEVANHICDIISHFGYPIKILSRLSRAFIEVVNEVLQHRLKELCVPLLIYHRQTRTLDLDTQFSIERMVTDLQKDHTLDWEVHLPARVFGLCFREHYTIKERPFSMLHCKGPQPVTAPRLVPFSVAEIRESTLVIQLNQKDRQDSDVYGQPGEESEKEPSGGNTLMQVSLVVQQGTT